MAEDVKICANPDCGKVFTRGNLVPANWRARRYCSRKCGQIEARRVRTKPPNEIEAFGDLVEMALTQGFKTILDLDRYPEVKSIRWYAVVDQRAKRVEACGFGKQTGREVKMHRLLCDFPNGLEVDHRNHDPLDNTTFNIRPATRTQNGHNTRARSSNFSSGVKGVFYRPKTGKYLAKIQYTDPATGLPVQKYLGCFADLESARQARIDAETRHHSAFARDSQGIDLI